MVLSEVMPRQVTFLSTCPICDDVVHVVRDTMTGSEKVLEACKHFRGIHSVGCGKLSFGKKE